MTNSEIDEAFRTADEIIAEANYNDEKWNLIFEGLSPAKMSVVVQWLEHLRPGFVEENPLVYILGNFDSNSHRKD